MKHALGISEDDGHPVLWWSLRDHKKWVEDHFHTAGVVARQEWYVMLPTVAADGHLYEGIRRSLYDEVEANERKRSSRILLVGELEGQLG